MRNIIEYKKAEFGDFFIGQNTGDGFVLMTDAFDEGKLERLYIIKGAAGTGKSTLMKKIAEEAEKLGRHAVRFACSSDADSLDGVVLDGRIGIADGTAPHTFDMKYPGARSSLVDLSVFWNDEELKKRADEVILHTEEKGKLFREAARYAKSAEIVYKGALKKSEELIDTDKCSKSIDRLIKKLKLTDGNGRIIRAATRAVGMKGAVRLDPFGITAETVYSVKGVTFQKDLYMVSLLEKLKRTGADVIYTVDPLFKTVNEVYLPEKRILFSVNDESSQNEINVRRFTDKEKHTKVRSDTMLASKIISSCADEVKKRLSSAGEHHFALEKIYSASMDFERLGEYTAFLTHKISEKLG